MAQANNVDFMLAMLARVPKHPSKAAQPILKQDAEESDYKYPIYFPHAILRHIFVLY